MVALGGLAMKTMQIALGFGVALLATTAMAQGKRPDIEGNWTNATMTSQTRPAQYGGRLAMTAEEVAKIENAAAAQIEKGNQRTDPNAPTVADGTVGGYNRGFLDPGLRVMRVRGEPRTSLITTPDGQPPAPRPGSKVSAAEMRAFSGSPYYLDQYGAAALYGEDQQTARRYNNPEEMSLADRCLTSFGRNGPPPMMSNGFYNNNYSIVQGTDAVVIVVEMVHDARRGAAQLAGAPGGLGAALVRRFRRLVRGRHAGGRDHQLFRRPRPSSAHGKT